MKIDRILNNLYPEVTREIWKRATQELTSQWTQQVPLSALLAAADCQARYYRKGYQNAENDSEAQLLRKAEIAENIRTGLHRMLFSKTDSMMESNYVDGMQWVTLARWTNEIGDNHVSLIESSISYTANQRTGSEVRVRDQRQLLNHISGRLSRIQESFLPFPSFSVANGFVECEHNMSETGNRPSKAVRDIIKLQFNVA